MKPFLVTVLSLFLASAALAGCSKDDADKSPTASPAADEGADKSAETAGAKEPAQTAEADDAGLMEAALDEYESIRAAFASDDVADAVARAEALAARAESAAEAASDEVREGLATVTTAARKLAATKVEDAAAARLAFGEVSRAVIDLLDRAPELREGRHVFECSMTRGFKKWVQTDDSISNPYMGTSMPACGSAAEWDTEG